MTKAALIPNAAARRIRASLTAALFWMALGQAALASPIVVGLIGDQTGSSNIDQSYTVLQQGVDALNAAGTPPAVVLHLGDLVESTQTPSQITTRFNQATGILGGLKAPWYMTPGDHDVNPPVFVQDSTDRSREQLFQQLYTPLNPLVAQNLYYSFNVQNWHFVALDSLEHLDTDPRWGNVFYAQISDQQFAWLQQDLQANAGGKDGIVVFLHQPLWYNWTGWKRVHALLAQYPVKAVIAGHTHYNQADSKLDGIQYWVVGSAGGDTKEGSPNAGDLHHVTTLSLSANDIAFNMIPLAPFVQNTWTDRSVMDQVQAISVILGNSYNFDASAQVFLQNGQLTGTCGASTPATVSLPDIGNAIAEPVNVSIVLNSPTTMLSAGTFGANFCQTDIDQYSCQLAPSAGVAVSNNSVVEMSQYPPPPPLWSGTVVPKNGASPAVGDPLTLELTMAFNEENQTYAISTLANTTVKKCQ
ncbi:metallophosphoesterase [Rhizobium sp. CF080]|uniref:metallophosphoesterase family protein n=1 Tax=Rhizobium sp. (strain CF080) TaxID=1144310 RepID=UPI00027189BC|nr:metallophosphoesterase [Rhizobium sp. CF080]EUB97566.1 metallophosphoesterase [Rhizobium sp. CF080]